MLVSDAKGRTVMSTADATSVGKVTGFLIDPEAAKVVALHLGKTSGAGDTLHWEDVKAFGSDAVTVASADTVVAARGRAAELIDAKSELIGKRVLDDRGDEHGTITDIDVDPVTGEVIALVLAQDSLPGSSLISSGSYAVVVRHAQE